MFTKIIARAKRVITMARNIRECACAGHDGIYDLRPYRDEVTSKAIRDTAARTAFAAKHGTPDLELDIAWAKYEASVMK